MCFCGLERGRRASRRDRRGADLACEMLPGAHDLSLGKLKPPPYHKTQHSQSGQRSCALELRQNRTIQVFVALVWLRAASSTRASQPRIAFPIFPGKVRTYFSVEEVSYSQCRSIFKKDCYCIPSNSVHDAS